MIIEIIGFWLTKNNGSVRLSLLVGVDIVLYIKYDGGNGLQTKYPVWIHLDTIKSADWARDPQSPPFKPSGTLRS